MQMALNPIIAFRLAPEIVSALRKIAHQQGRSLSNLLQYIVQQYLLDQSVKQAQKAGARAKKIKNVSPKI